MLAAAKSPIEEHCNFIGEIRGKLTEKERLTSAAGKVIKTGDNFRTVNSQRTDLLF
jgi:hypothetical protein